MGLTNLMGLHGFEVVDVRHDMCPVAKNLTGAILTMLFRRRSEIRMYVRDLKSGEGIRKYISACRSWEERERSFIEALVKSQRPILVWGLGTLCQRLLATTLLPQANIRAFIDSNPHYQGVKFMGHPVLNPSEVIGYKDAILISSWVFHEEIVQQIRGEMNCKNDILSLPMILGES